MGWKEVGHSVAYAPRSPLQHCELVLSSSCSHFKRLLSTYRSPLNWLNWS